MMPNKLIAFVLVFFVFFGIGVCPCAASDDITLVINDKTVDSDVNPMIINGRTMVPVRILFDTFGADVLWNENLRQVIISTAASVIVFTIGSKTAYIDGVGRTVDVPPTIVEGRTLVPIRFISDVLRYDVVWNGSTRTVYVTGKKHASIPDDDPASLPSDESKEEIALATLSRITAVEKTDAVDITVSLSEKIEPKVMKLSEPDRLVFDFYSVEQTCNNSNLQFENTSVTEIRWASHPDYTRIVVQTTEQTDYSLRYTSAACIITIGKTAYVPDDDDKDADDDASSSGNVTEPPKVSGGAPIVVIDAGHGGYDSGAIGRDADGNEVIKEKDANLSIAQKVSQKLKSSGIKVIMTRSADVALGDTVMADLVARAEIANRSGADLFISIHNNAFTDPEATGTSVLYAGLSNSGGYGISSKELAENIQAPLVKATGLKDRGIVRSPEMVVLKRTIMPAVLIECAFVSSYTDQKVLTNDKKISDIAEAIYQGILVSLRQMDKIS